MNFPIIPSSFKHDQVLYLRDLTLAVGKYLSSRISRDVATDQVLLTSPSKKIYSVKVDDAGNIVTELVQE